MKNILFPVLFLAAIAANAQAINWGEDSPLSKHLVFAHAGLNYGLVFGAGYGYRLPTKRPILFSAEYSFPSGATVFDDFKTRIGGQFHLYRFRDFHVSAQAYGVFRRYHSDFASIANFGSDFSAVAGCYRPHWFAAAEIGFDKAIVSHFKHSRAYRDIYPQVQDGWYEPAMGGNFAYGLQTGLTLKKNTLTLKAGKLVAQNLRAAPLFPFYAQLAYNRRF